MNYHPLNQTLMSFQTLPQSQNKIIGKENVLITIIKIKRKNVGNANKKDTMLLNVQLKDKIKT